MIYRRYYLSLIKVCKPYNSVVFGDKIGDVLMYSALTPFAIALTIAQYIWQWASNQIRKIGGWACTGNAGNVLPATDFTGNRKLAISECITARVSTLTCGGGENVPGIPGAWATLNFTCLERGPWVNCKTINHFLGEYMSSYITPNDS